MLGEIIIFISIGSTSQYGGVPYQLRLHHILLEYKHWFYKETFRYNNLFVIIDNANYINIFLFEYWTEYIYYDSQISKKLNIFYDFGLLQLRWFSYTCISVLFIVISINNYG